VGKGFTPGHVAYTLATIAARVALTTDYPARAEAEFRASSFLFYSGGHARLVPYSEGAGAAVHRWHRFPDCLLSRNKAPFG
jgi:hypothetical protein